MSETDYKYCNTYLITRIQQRSCAALLRRLFADTRVTKGNVASLEADRVPNDVGMLLLCTKKGTDDCTMYVPGHLAWDDSDSVEFYAEQFPYETLHPVSPWVFYLEARRQFPR